MVKILFFIENLTGGGAEKVLCNLVNHMDLTKFDITVHTVWPCDARKYLVPGVRYKTIYSSVNRLNRLRYRIVAESGLAYKIYVKDNYDIECAYLEMGSTKVLASSTNKKSKKLAWVHCDLTKAVADTMAYVEKTKSWYAKYDRVICVSQNVKEKFDELYQNKFNSCVLYNVVDDTVIREKALHPLPEGIKRNRFTVLSVGRLTPPKKYIRLLHAHKRLLDEGIKHDLWILGDGPQRPELEQYVTENDLRESVLMPGFMENPYPFMREADLLACSSIYEGYSTFLTEGVVLNKPIITTNVSGTFELLGNSEFGLIVENDDEAFFRGLKQMLTDTALRGKYENAISKRSKTISAERMTETTEQFFEGLIIK